MPASATAPRFTVSTVQPRTDSDRQGHDTETDAVADAESRVGPQIRQASIEVSAGDHDSFAVRSFVWEPNIRAIRDTGWRRWRAGKFIGGGDLADLFGEHR